MINDITTEARTMSRSAVRHRPILPEQPNKQVLTPRASRARQKPELHTADVLPSAVASAPQIPTRTTSKVSRTWLIYMALGMLCACVLLWGGQMLWNWGHAVSDDLHYGRPRTTNVDHFVGHETGNTPSHFTALNLNGQVYVIEIPGGSPNTSHLLVGPHLIGPSSDLAPVSLVFTGDPHHPDLLIVVDAIQVHFHNTGSEYVSTS